nr:hypothetical protein [Tanacetum cinerariifolium]
YVVPTGRVVVPTGRYAVLTGRVVVPTSRVISPGRIPTGRVVVPTGRVISPGVLQLVAPTTAEQRLACKNELKARGTLLMAFPDKHQLKFNSHKDAETLMEAIQKRFGGNTETKKVQKTLLKQQFENFTGSSSEDVNLKFLHSLPSEWKTHTLIWRNKADLEEQSLDDFAAASVSAGCAKLPASPLPNVDSLSNTLIYSFFASQSTSPQLDNEDLKHIDVDDLEEIDLRWQMAMLTMWARRKGHFARECRSSKDPRRPGAADLLSRIIPVETSTSNALVSQCDEEEPANFALMDFSSSSSDNETGLESVEARLLVYKQNESVFEENIKLLNIEVQLRDTALATLRQKLDKVENDKDDLKLKLEKFQTSFKNLSELLASQTSEKTGLGYNSQLSPTKLVQNLSHTTRPSEPIIEDWLSDSDTESEPKAPQFVSSFAQSSKHVKSLRHTVQQIKTTIPAATSVPASLKSNSNGQRRNRKTCFVYKSVDHLIKDYDFHTKKMAQPTQRNYAHRGHHKQYAPLTRSKPQKHMVPTAVLTQSKPVSNTAVRPVSAALPNITVTRPRHAHHIVTKLKSPIRRHITRSPSSKTSNSPPRVTAVQAPVGNPRQALKDKGVIDSGCSRHMTGNMSYLSDFEELNEGYVTFRGNPKGGKITGKGKIKTGKLDFDDVYFVKELKFNLFSVSQMGDKKNSVLFTDTECLVLSLDFKLPDESQVLLRVPRENNMYNVNLKNIVPSGDFTFLFAKATIDESNLWHRKLAHINFKTINKLVKGNLVRGLPIKVFEHDHSCVACKKGKQHRASCKTKPISFVDQPLFRLHMDLFGPAFVKSLNKKSYCLVITDDYSRFTWVFFLATKDETSPILKIFITGLENQLSLKVKVIGSDNRTEFKNSDLNQFCELKGIKREFSVPRTPQQNGIAERKNQTLIEAARTMLADLLLTIPFWAEAVNTACYLQNRVLVTKPHNKTPYELLHGRTPSIGFMRPFGGPETILNTLDPLGKFQGKVDEGFLVGYSVLENKHLGYLTVEPVLFNQSMQEIKLTLVQNNAEDAAFDGKEHVFDVKKLESEVILFPSSSAQSKEQDDKTKKEGKGKSPVESVTGYRDLNAEFEDCSENSSNEVNADEADFNNLEYSIPVSPIPTTRIHKDHLVSQIIGDLSLTTQTRSMTGAVKDQGGLSQMFGNNFHTCMFACFLSQKEPKRVLVDLPYGKRAIGTKWVYRNKKDKRGIVIRNKARLVAQGHTQEEGIDYEEVFAPVVTIEAIRLFLAYASFMGFMVYQMDVKSTFIYRTIEEEVYVCQPLGFEDPDHPDKVYKVVNALYGLHQALRACTPIDIEKPLLKDSDGEDVDVHTYTSVIGSLMYLTSSRPDVMFAVCAGCKKQTVVTTSSTEVEYVDAASCCAQTKDVTRLQALVDRKKVVITEAAISDVLRLDDAEGVDCLPNEEIFAELARIGYENPSTKLTFYKAFFSSQWKFLIYTILQSMSAKHTSWNKFSSAMASAVICLFTYRRFNFSKYIFESLGGKGFLRIETPLFEGMLVAGVIEEEGDADEQVQDDVDDVAAQGADTVVQRDDVHAPSIPSPTPPTPPPQQSQDLSSTSQEALDTYATLTRRVEHLEYDKVAQAHEITKLKRRVKKLKKGNRVKVLKMRRLHKVRTSQRIDTSKDTVMKDSSNQGRMIDDLVKDDAAEDDPAEVQEVVDVVITAKLITEVVTAASETVTAVSTTISAAEPQVPAAAITTAALVRVAAASTKRRKGVVIRDPEEESTTTIPVDTKSKDKGKGIMLEEEENRAIQSINETPAQKATKRRKLNEEVEDLKKHLEIMIDKDDDVYTEATPLARKVPVVDYEIIHLNNKPHYKIIRADGTHQIKRSQQQVAPTIVEIPIVTMADQRTMTELLQAPTEGYEDAIVVPAILTENFKLKHGLLNLVTSKQFYGHDKEDPHAHIRWFNKITSTMRYPNVPNTSIKLMLFPFSIEGAARIWLEKEHPRSILTWEDLVSKFINQFFPPSKTTNLRNEITNFQQRFDESFCEAWDRFKDLLRACLHHGFTLLRQNKNQTPAFIKAVEDSCVTCGGLHPYYNCTAIDGNVFKDNIQEYVSAAAVNYNQGNTGFRPKVATNYRANQISPPGFPPVQNNQNRYNQNQDQSYNQNRGNYQPSIQHPRVEPPNEFSSYKKITETSIHVMQNQITNLKAEMKNEIHSSIQNQINNVKNKLRSGISNQTNELRNMMANFFQKNTASTSGLRPLPSNTIAKPRGTYFVDALLHMPKFALMFKSLLNNKEKLFDLATTPMNENFSALVECLALADLGASINLMPLSIWKKLSPPELTPTRMILELVDRSTTRPPGIAEDVFVKVGKFHFSTDFVVVDYVVDPRVPLILGRPFLRTERALIDVYGTSDELFNLVDDYYDTEGDILYLEKLLNEDPSSNLPPVKNEDLKQVNATTIKPSIKEPPKLELKELPSHLEYAFLEGTDKLHVIISKELKDEEKSALLKVLNFGVDAAMDHEENTKCLMLLVKTANDITTDSVSAAASVSAACVKLHTSPLPNIDVDDLEEIDLRWQMAMLTMRARRKGHFARECRSPKDPRRPDTVEPQRRTIFVEPLTSNALVSQCDESDCESWPPSNLYDRFQPSGGYHVVPPPYTRTFMPAKPDLVFNIAPIAIKTDHLAFNFVPSFAQSIEHVKTPRHSVQPIETIFQTATSIPASPKSNSSSKRRNRKACFVCKSVDHLIKDSLTQSKPVSNTVVRPLSAALPNITVTRPRNTHQVVTKSKSPIRRYINRNPSSRTSNSPPRVNVVQVPVVSAAQGKQGTWGNPQLALQDKRVIDSGCSRHMTGNMSYLSDFKELNRGYVAFGGNLKGGKIIGKGKIKTDKLEFNNVYFVKELKFNLFSVSQMCDKKNSVLFTDTECRVLSSEFKLPDESQVLFRVPRENNMYNVNLKNIVPSGDLTCLFAKATLDESNLWHRRLAHKGKQHRASCKTKPVSSIDQPFFRLHMDLFGPTFVKRPNKKSYCLVITDDYSRFTWMFFLATKDETTPILKTFLTGLENQLCLTMKVIRSDNGIEFRNSDLNQLCRLNGIKKEFSVPRTPQQNGIAERKNRTLIEAARTMMADSVLPIPFRARQLTLLAMSKIGCKFQGKVDERFFVGYSVCSKAFRVFKSRTCIIQETLHVNYLENKPNVAGTGPTWLFDIDSLTKTMNYQPVHAGNQTNSGAEDAAFDGKEHDFDVKKPESKVILSPNSSSQSKEQDDKTIKEAKGKSPVESVTGYRDLNAEFQDCSENSSNEVTTASSTVPTVGQNSFNNTNTFSAVGPSNTTVSPTYGQTVDIDASQLPDDPDIPGLEDIIYSDDEDVVGAKADFNNLEDYIPVSPIPTIRIHKDHLVSQIIDDLSSTTQTRSMTRAEEPKRVHQALKDPSWIEAMQEEILQFKMQKVWVLVDLPYGKRAIGTNWVYRNKKDERGIMDVKSVFLYGTIEEEVYVYQPPGFEDPDHPDKVYKVVKALYGLHQAPRACKKEYFLLVQIYVDDIIFSATNKDLYISFEKLMKDKFQMRFMGELTFFLGLQVKKKKDGIFISQDKYVAEILRKFGLTEGKSASTPIDTEKPLLKDSNGKDVDVHTYTSIIGSLMYLTSSRPDVMFAVCAGDSPFDLVAYSDSDYPGASLDRKSTTGGCQFLRYRLISWQCKKQTVVATSFTEAEYVVAASCCAQSNDVTRLQALVDKKKVVITEATIRDALHLDDAEGVDCLPNEEIFADLACMGYEKPSTKLNFYKVFFSSHWKFLIHTILQSLSAKRTSWNKFNSAMASAVICLSIGRKFNFSKYIFESLVRNVDNSSNFYMYLRFMQLIIQNQLGDLSTHTTTYISLALTQKVFANMRRVGKGFLGVETPLFEGMLVAGEIQEQGDAEEQVQDDIDNVAAQGANTAAEGDAIHKPSIPYPTPPTPPPQQSQDLPSPSQEAVDALRVAAASTRRRKRVVIRDPEEESTAIIPADTKSNDKGKEIMVEEPKPMKKKQQIEIDEEYARKLHEELNKDIDWDVAIDHEEQNKAIQSINETPAQKAAKGRKLNEEVEDLKQHLEIVPDEDNDVYTEATPLARKVPVVDYEIIHFNNKPHYKIMRADRTHQLYVSFITLLKNFNREDLESLWSLVKERFSTSKPNNFSDDYLLTTLGAIFERPDGQAQVWKNQRTVHGQARVKSWKLLESCSVHIITFTTTQVIFLVERRYPLTRFTLDQMLNAVRLRVEEHNEMALELLSFGVDAAMDHEENTKCLMLLVNTANDMLMLSNTRAENLAADHLSRLENPHQDELEKKEITEAFPLETLGMIAFRVDSSTSWFADIANYTAKKVFDSGFYWSTIYRDAHDVVTR